jgi:gamma-glutamyltranspeptidase/glutathione hydrolase
VDGTGNLVALTTTLNGAFGCKLYVPGAGFFLNNEMDDFTTAPARPNLFGLVQGEGNVVRPGKRMLSSQSPTIAWKKQEAMVLGGKGGSRIPTSVMQVLLDVIVDEHDLSTAIVQPRIHHQWLPDQISVEPDALGEEVRAELKRRGHTLEGSVPSHATVNALRLRRDGSVEAVADPRGPGVAGVVIEVGEH